MQQQDDLRMRAEEALKEKSIVDMLIDGTQSLDEAVGSIPKTPNMDYSSNLRDLDKNLEEFDRKYNGTPDTESEHYVEGKISSFISRVTKKLFGGYETVVEKGEMGLREEGTLIYEEAKKDLDAAVSAIPSIKKGIRMQESYKGKLEKYLKQHSKIFFTCDAKSKEISDLIQGFEDRYEDPGTSIDEKRVIKGYLSNLKEKAQQTHQTMKNVEHRAVAYQQNLKYVSQQVKLNNDQVSMLETRIATTQANVEGFKIQVEGLSIPDDMMRITKRLSRMHKATVEHTKKAHEMYVQMAEAQQQLFAQNGDQNIYNDDMTQELSDQNEQFGDLNKADDDMMYSRAKAIFLNLE